MLVSIKYSTNSTVILQNSTLRLNKLISLLHFKKIFKFLYHVSSLTVSCLSSFQKPIHKEISIIPKFHFSSKSFKIFFLFYLPLLIDLKYNNNTCYLYFNKKNMMNCFQKKKIFNNSGNNKQVFWFLWKH